MVPCNRTSCHMLPYVEDHYLDLGISSDGGNDGPVAVRMACGSTTDDPISFGWLDTRHRYYAETDPQGTSMTGAKQARNVRVHSTCEPDLSS